MHNKRIHPVLYGFVLYFKSMTWASSQKGGTSINQWKYIYTNACSIGNKQEELEDTAQLKNYDIAEIMESVSFSVGINDLNILFKLK